MYNLTVYLVCPNSYIAPDNRLAPVTKNYSYNLFDNQLE